ncbi:hypothetical protein HDU85_003156 [Gaertneriomyces sp. JEL0708]|nr:hypothetical protein HDU85_003156 [Gaertneriomyces sp. JEL0708]
MVNHLHHINLSIAILLCDIPLPSVLAEYGDYTKIFNDLFERSISQRTLKPPIEFTLTPFNVTNDEYPSDPSEFDAYLITGSKYSAYEPTPWIVHLKQFIKRLHEETSSRIVGICFGHQIIAEALGGKVVKNERGWEIGWTELRITGSGNTLFKKDFVNIHQMHQDHVAVVPEGFEIVAETHRCPVQVMKKGTRWLCIQGHPEFVAGIVKHIVTARKASGVFGPETCDEVLSKVDNEVDEPLLGGLVIEWLAGTIQARG